MTVDRPDLRVAWTLQGAAAILYMLSSAGSVFPVGTLDQIRPLDGLLASGNLALGVLFTAFGFTLASSLLADVNATIRSLLAIWVRAVLPAVVAMLLVSLAALAVARYDDTDTTSGEVTRTSLLHAWTFMQNQWILDHILLVRSDVSSLWIVSVLVQYSVVAGIVVVVLRKHRRVLGVLALVTAATAIGWRSIQLGSDGWLPAALDSFGRSDGFALGVCAACMLGGLRISSAGASELLGGTSMVLAAGALTTPFVGVDAIFNVILPLTSALTAVTVWAGASEPDSRGLASVALRHSEAYRMAWLAMPLVVWAPFIAATGDRHADGHPSSLLVAFVVVGSAAASAATMLLMIRGPSWVKRQWNASADQAERVSAHDGDR